MVHRHLNPLLSLPGHSAASLYSGSIRHHHQEGQGSEQPKGQQRALGAPSTPRFEGFLHVVGALETLLRVEFLQQVPQLRVIVLRCAPQVLVGMYNFLPPRARRVMARLGFGLPRAQYSGGMARPGERR